MQNPNRCQLPTLRHVATEKLTEVVKEANEVISTIATGCITETNQLLYSTAYVVTKELGCKVSIKTKLAKTKTEPPWKRRLQLKIKTLRADVSSLEHLKSGTLQNQYTKQRLVQQYQLEKKTVTEVAEVLKQRIRAVAKKIEWYKARIAQFRQNRLFRTDQQRF
jgi:DNA-directed RNA polymerase alpha subunit